MSTKSRFLSESRFTFLEDTGGHSKRLHRLDLAAQFFGRSLSRERFGGVSAGLFWLIDLRRRSKGEPSVGTAAVIAFAVTIGAHGLLALTSGVSSVLRLAIVSVPVVRLPCLISNLLARFFWLRHAATPENCAQPTAVTAVRVRVVSHEPALRTALRRSARRRPFSCSWAKAQSTEAA